MLKKVERSLLTLLDVEKELCYVVLCNIKTLICSFPGFLQSALANFSCRALEPSYIIIEKLEIMTLLSTEENLSCILSELELYVTERFLSLFNVCSALGTLNNHTVMAAMTMAGTCACKHPESAERFVEILFSFVANVPDYVECFVPVYTVS